MTFARVAPVGVGEETQKEEKHGNGCQDKDEADWGAEPRASVVGGSLPTGSTSGSVSKSAEKSVSLAT